MFLKFKTYKWQYINHNMNTFNYYKIIVFNYTINCKI